ncbi:MAG: [Fe-Fe] hydrogenase large subunit C-terminal domain-containing protein, partial [Spirochaetaceae bacterium]|nr:[Fe-Fe] hydrogenase large subunit C-terminal domain-containing protein [Spirochaetaceae bacterium]
WVMAARAFFPELAEQIADSYTPMVETAKKIKETNTKTKVIFIGPCVAKKYEALTEEMAEYVDHVLTFEELAALFVAYDIDISMIENADFIEDAGALGRGYAIAGGVGEAIIKTAEKEYGLTDIRFERADTLADCRRMLAQLQKGSIHADLIEGMACPGGCVGGPGTLAPIKQASRQVARFAESATFTYPTCDDDSIPNDSSNNG